MEGKRFISFTFVPNVEMSILKNCSESSEGIKKREQRDSSSSLMNKRHHPQTMKIFGIFRLGLWLRSPFGLRVKGYVKFLRPAFAEAATRRQANNVTE